MVQYAKKRSARRKRYTATMEFEDNLMSSVICVKHLAYSLQSLDVTVDEKGIATAV